MKATKQQHLAQAFTNKSKEKPDREAINYSDHTITYSFLDQYSNKIAQELEKKVKTQKDLCQTQKVAILLDRTPQLVASILATLKAGIIFVPIDPGIPVQRIHLMIKEAGAGTIITVETHQEKIQELHSLTLILLENSLHMKNLEKIEHQDWEINYNQYAYVFFTSGSTGTPKAILGLHRSLEHFINWEINEFNITQENRVSLLTSPSFDAILRDIFVPLSIGGASVIPRNIEITNPGKLMNWIQRQKISIIHTVPSYFRVMIHSQEHIKSLEHLRYLFLSGEMLKGSDIKNLQPVLKKKLEVVNFYGPTETTMIKLFYRIQKEDMEKAIIPVGKAMKGAQAMVLDEAKKPCLVGNTGEIYIRTPYMTEGYINDEESTNEKFLKNPFSENPKDKIYKTGDLGKWREDGNIEMLGRLDDQVKIRGIRVETGEIEHLLQDHPHIKSAKVVPLQTNETEEIILWAYIESIKSIPYTDLKERLYRQLPQYMIPAGFMIMEHLPRLPNGKIDKDSLPKPDSLLDREEGEAQKPMDEIEEKLASIWSGILGIKKEKISRGDDFFDLGGHSLRGMIFITKVKNELGVELSLKTIFRKSTIKEIANIIRKGKKRKVQPILVQEKKEYYELSSPQKRLFFLHLMEAGKSTGYNLIRVVRMKGKPDTNQLKTTFDQLISRHESLRTSFQIKDENPIQRIHTRIEFQIKENKTIQSPEEIKEQIEESITPFDLSKPPLIRAEIFKPGEDQVIMVVQTHHIISDGTSMALLTNEFMRVYSGEKPKPLQIQYKDFAAWQNILRHSEEIQEQEEFWMEMLSESGKMNIPRLNLATDYPRPQVITFHGDSHLFKLDSTHTSAFNKIGKQQGATLFMNLLALFNVLLFKYTGQTDIIIGSGDAGRNHADLQEVIGMFVNSWCVRNQPMGELSYQEFLKEVKNKTLEVLENREVQFEMLVEKLKLERESDRNPIFDVFLGVQNYELPEIQAQLPGEVTLESYEFENKITRFDLTLYANEMRGELYFSLEYATALFKKSTIIEMSRDICDLIKQVCENSKIKLSDLIITNDFSTINTENFQDYQEDFAF